MLTNAYGVSGWVGIKYPNENERRGPDHQCGPLILCGPIISDGPKVPSLCFIISRKNV